MPASPIVILPNVSASAPVQASVTTALTGANNDARWTWLFPGTVGNGKTVEYTISGSFPVVSVTTVGNPVTGVLVTGPVGTTLNQVRAAATASATVSAKVQCDLSTGNDGTGTVITLASTPFTGGLGVAPAAPTSILP